MKDSFDDQCKGQMVIDDLFDPPERLIAVSRIFARARKQMNLTEQKTFAYALSKLKFTEEANNLSVRLDTKDKKVLAKILDLNGDANHLSGNLFKSIKDLTQHSYIEIDMKDKDIESSGVVITDVTRVGRIIEISFNQKYIKLFVGLSSDYITMWSSDIFQMKSKRSVQFYEYLRQITDTRHEINQVGLGVKDIKEMFDIPKEGEGSYMRKDGHFDRAAFEKYVVQSLCDDLKNCKMIQLVVQPNGKMYEKVKRGNRVLGYRFYWTFSSRPGIATAEEVAQIQERVDDDPQVLKVAKDIVNGKKTAKKSGKSKKQNSFTDFEQRAYDFDELEAALIQSHRQEDDKK